MIAPCDHAAAVYAMEQWHYADTTPIGKLVKYGVWNDGGEFVGAVVFGRGANRHIGNPFGVGWTEACELVRVALSGAQDRPTSAIVAAALREISRTQPGLRVVVSYADTKYGHRGVIYQASNWTYLGSTTPDIEYLIDGKWEHLRNVASTMFGRLNPVKAAIALDAPSRPTSVKHRYAFPLDRAMRRRLRPLSLPYP